MTKEPTPELKKHVKALLLAEQSQELERRGKGRPLGSAVGSPNGLGKANNDPDGWAEEMMAEKLLPNRRIP